MNIMFNTEYHYLTEKKEDETAPLCGIVLIDLDDLENGQTYRMRKQLKDFSIAMQKYGIAWSERYKQYVIPDTICFNKERFNKLMRIINATLIKYNRGESIVSEEERDRETTQSYYTKESAVEYLIGFVNEHLDKNKKCIILDPAAGEGRLVDSINAPKDSIWLIEPDQECCEILRKKGYVHIINTTFQEAVRDNLIPRPTHVIMNPPFSKQQDIKFYDLACRLIQSNGVISAIISENSIYEELKKYNFVLDDGPSISQSRDILMSKEACELSNHMREFLNNLANSKWLSLDYVNGEFAFENTQARAFFIRAIAKERERSDMVTHQSFDDEGR